MSKSQTSIKLNISIYTLFFFSGAFALIYELSWVRAITLEFGSTTLAVSTVVAVFMGGLALGAYLVSKWVDRFLKPLTVYGLIEIAIALYAILTPFIFRHVLPLFSLLGIRISDNIWFIFSLRFFLAALLLLFPTVLMGTTLPLLSRFYANKKHDAAQKGGILYGMNTIGAFAGTIAAGFILLPNLGLSRTVCLVAISNAIIGSVAVLIGRRTEVGSQNGQILTVKGFSKTNFKPTFTSIAVALTGFAGLACEIIWTRVIIMVIGGSVYAFSIVLATFLAGLGLGAAIIAAILRSGKAEAIKIFYSLALFSAILIAVTCVVFKYLPWLFVRMFWSFGSLENPGNIFYIQAFVAGLVLLYPAFVIGGLFPTALRIVKEKRKNIAEKIAQLYSWNTIGSIIGSITAGFILIPVLGMRGAFLAVIGVYCLAGILITVEWGKISKVIYSTIGGLCLFVLLVWLMPPWHNDIMTAGIYRASVLKNLPRTGVRNSNDLLKGLRTHQDILYYRDGVTATVTVTKSHNTPGLNEQLSIAINGKPDGSSTADMPTQRLLAHFPLLLHPNPRTVCVVGMGTGCTAGSVSLYHPEQTTVVEIEPAVVEGAQFFKEHNHNIHENPNVNIRTTDGRLFLRLHPDSYDVIISAPSNPWMAGVANLFTLEFFELCARSLRQGGFMCQWCPLYGMSPENLKIVIRTFINVFPYTYVISSIPHTDILLLGSKEPFYLNMDRIKARMTDPLIKDDLADERVGIQTIYELISRVRLGPDDVKRLAGKGPVNSDDRTIVSYLAPKEMYSDFRFDNEEMLASFGSGIESHIQMDSATEEQKQDFQHKVQDAYLKYFSQLKRRR